MFDRINVNIKKTSTVHQLDGFQNWRNRHNSYPSPVNVQSRCFKSSQLPYENELKTMNPTVEYKRENCSTIVLRGDDRDIDTIQAAGGFHPNSTYQFHRDNPLDIRSHRIDSSGSGFLSTTKSPGTAHSYGVTFANRTKSKELSFWGYTFLRWNYHVREYTLYALEVDGAVFLAPEQLRKHQLFDIDEYSVPGGVDADRIVAFRKCKLKSQPQYSQEGGKYFSILTRCGDVFFNSKYKFNKKIADGLLFNGESIDEPHQLQKGPSLNQMK